MAVVIAPLLAALAAPLLAALIQVKGTPLAGGSVLGRGSVPLERAAGGDTPVLSLRSYHGSLRLLLDTGASSTMVTPALVARLGLGSRAMDAGAFELAGGGSACAQLQPGRTLLPPLQLVASPHERASAGVQLVGVEALVLPVAALPPGIDGVLGAPSLRRLPLLVDPKLGRVSFGAAALSAAQAPAVGSPKPSRPRSPLRLPLRWRGGVPLLRLVVPGGTVWALADTGAEGLFLSPDLAGQLNPQGAPQPLRLVGFCGEQPVMRQRFTGLALQGGPAGAGGVEGGVEGIITENAVFRQLGVEAIVGQELLRPYRQLWRLDLAPPQLELQ